MQDNDDKRKAQPIGHREKGRSRERAIGALFDDLPENPLEQIRSVRKIYSALRVQAAKVLSAAITDLLKQTGNRLPIDEADSVVQDINQVLADSRLAVFNAQSDHQSKLSVLRPSPSNGYGYLRLFDPSPSAGGKRAMLSVNKLDLGRTPVRLVEDSSIKSGRSR